MTIDGQQVHANYASGSDTKNLLFTYTLTKAMNNSFSIGANSLVLSGGTIADPSGNNLDLATVSAFTFDTTAPTVTNSSASYTFMTKTLVLTGTHFDSLLETGETASTDIKARLDWSKLSWDYNGDNGTTADTSFQLSDISSAKVTDATHLTVVLTNTKADSLVNNLNYGSTGGADKLDISAGFAKDLAGNIATTDVKADAGLTVTEPQKAGEATIDLGSLGKLIAGVQVDGGKWYYYLDRNGDGLTTSADTFTHNELDQIFIYGSDFSTPHTQQNLQNPQMVNGQWVFPLETVYDTTDTYRYGAINGVHLALPTVGASTSPSTIFGSAIGYQSSLDNSTYNDLAAVWDAYNNSSNKMMNDGTPSGWASGSVEYWSATDKSGGDHYSVSLSAGQSSQMSQDTDSKYVVLQVL
jgi:hypothetical protein